MSDIPPIPDGGIDPQWTSFVSRLMAGYEAAHRRVIEMYELQGRRLQDADTATARAIEMQLKMAAELEDLISRRHERELATEHARARAQALGDITRDVRAIAPLALKKLLGVPLTGNDSHGLQDLLTTLSPEQLDGVMTSGELKLSPAQQQALVHVLGSLAQKEGVSDAAE